jgi:penicillin-binding protein 1B
MKSFSQPSGVVDVQLDKVTNLLATPTCPQTYTAAFVTGTEPTTTCDQATGIRGVLSKIFSLGNEQPQPPNTAQQQPPDQKKKGFFGKIAGIFKDDKQSAPPPKPPDSSPH